MYGNGNSRNEGKIGKEVEIFSMLLSVFELDLLLLNGNNDVDKLYTRGWTEGVDSKWLMRWRKLC